MVCFEIRRNGERIGLAGVDSGVLSAVISSVGGPRGTAELQLEVGGLVEETHLYWAESWLSVGDRIEIRIVEAETPDPPIREHRDPPGMKESAERRYYERLKAKYEG